MAAGVAAILLSMAATVASGQSLTARTVRFSSTTLGGQATFAILVPPDYDSSATRYPVVYLLHGGTQNHTAFPARAWFAREISRRNVIAVMPHVPQILYNPRGGSLPFEALIAELVQYVDTHYRTVAARDGRAISGLSMGGFGAVVAGLTHPEVFGTVGAFSGAFGSGREAMPADAVTALPAERAPFFYLACGVADTALRASRDFVSLLQRRDIAHEYREVPGGHTWDVWDPQTLAFLETLTSRPRFVPIKE